MFIPAQSADHDPTRTSRDGEVQLELFEDDQDRVIRRRVALWDDTPKNPTLMGLYRHWESLRPDGLLPARSEFDIQKLKPVMGMTSMVELDEADPLDFRVRLYGTTVPKMTSGGRSPSVREIKSKPYREMLCRDYGSCREIGVPLYHEIAAIIDFITHSYARLILPFSTDGKRVTQLMVCSAHQKFPNLLQRLD